MKTEEIKTLEKILENEKISNEIEQVFRFNKNETCDNYVKQVEFNKKYNLPLGSKIGLLMAIGRQTEL